MHTREIQTVKNYATKHNLWCRDMDWFIKSVLYRQSKLNKYMPEPKLIIGHNLPFDLGAISNRTVKSRDPKFHGALSIGMCRCFERPAEEQIELMPMKNIVLVGIIPIFELRS